MKRLAAVVALVALALPGAAWAHATLQKISPSVGERLASSPRVVRLGFDQSVKTLPNGIRVYDATGTLVSGVAHSAGAARRSRSRCNALPRGAYTVRWSAISNDSHVGHGVFTFGVRVKAPALDRGVRRERADDLGARRALAVLPLPRPADRRARLPARRAARRRDARGGAAVLPAHRYRA